MKKNILILILLAFLTILFVGCGEDKPTPKPDDPVVDPTPGDDPVVDPTDDPVVEYNLEVSEANVQLNVGEEKRLSATITPSATLVWESSDNSVLTVSGGLIKAMKAGSATVTVRTEDGKVKKEVKVTVVEVAHHEIDDLATALKATLDKYLESDSFNVLIEVTKDSQKTLMEMIYNKASSGLYDEFFYQIKGNITTMTYVKGDTAYMLDESVKKKATLSSGEKEALVKDYNGSEFLSKVASFYDEAAFFTALEVVNEKEFKLILNKYEGKALNVNGIDSVTLKVEYSEGYVTKVELSYSNGSKVSVSYRGFGHQTITEPSDLNTYTE